MIKKPHVVIIGGGFGGLYAAQKLGSYNFPVTLIDKQNFHLFQPLLYQVATGFLSPSDIAVPLREILSRNQSINIIQDEVIDILPDAKQVITTSSKFSFDILIVATGATHSYFGKDELSKYAPGLKSITDSIELRSKILSAFEAAEISKDKKEQERLLTFAIIGGGPTGVELAGAISELAHKTLKNEFRNFDLADTRILLCESGDRILQSFDIKNSDYAVKTLNKIGVEILLHTYVVDAGKDYISIKQGEVISRIDVNTIIWAAGMKASPLSNILKNHTNIELDRMGRVKVNKDLSIPEHPDIFVIGDLAHFELEPGKTLPGLAPVAMQQGSYVAKLIYNKTINKINKDFTYCDKGNMAVIGKGRAVANIRGICLNGFLAWLSWALIHIYFLIEFEAKLVIFFHWIWNYLTNKRGSRLIPK